LLRPERLIFRTNTFYLQRTGTWTASVQIGRLRLAGTEIAKGHFIFMGNTRKLKAALISAGMISNAAHIPAYKNLAADVDLVAVCDINETAANETAQRHGIPHVFTDAKTMLETIQPDIVSVCTSNSSHKALSLLALEHGANVICEKPVAITYQDAVELYDTAKRCNRMLVACQTVRYYPEHLVAKDIVSSGILGDIYFAELSRIRRRGLPAWGNFHKKAINGGGALCDIGVHLIDAILWIMGNPKMEAVTGIKTNRIARSGESLIFSMAEAGAPAGVFGKEASYKPEEFETEEFGAGAIRLEGGGVLNFKVGWAANLPNSTTMSIAGDKAGILVPELKIISSVCKYQADIEPRWFNEGKYKDKVFYGHWYLIENVVDAILGRAELMVKPEETINVAAIIDAFYRSTDLGREVTFKELV